MLILGIDPGLNTGWALVDTSGPRLLRAGLGDPRKEFSPVYPDRVILEYPVVYPHGTDNPNDLIKLAIMVGEYLGYFGRQRVLLTTPAGWKGQVPKAVTEKRVRAQVQEAGFILDAYPKSTRHNVSDAIGLALWGVQRLSVRR